MKMNFLKIYNVNWAVFPYSIRKLPLLEIPHMRCLPHALAEKQFFLNQAEAKSFDK